MASDKICYGCGEGRGVTHAEFGKHWHFACLLRERAKFKTHEAVKRPDRLDPGSRKARALRGKGLKSLTVSQDTFDKLKAFAAEAGMSHAKAIRWLVDNRPETKFVISEEDLETDVESDSE